MKVLIVGGGLSGICLAHTFLENNQGFKIIDSGKNYSSKVAAGMINPMVFRKMVKTWRGDEVIPFLEDFYPKIESKTNARFFFQRKLRRVFSTPEEAKLWKERLTDSSYNNYICRPSEEDEAPNYIKDAFGSGWVKSPGYIEPKSFMEANRSYFKNLGLLSTTLFNYDKFDPEECIYDGKKYKAVVFAEGHHVKNNPLFSYLPIIEAKGEVLTITSNEIRKNEILNRKCFVLPQEDGKFKLGATFTWNPTDSEPTKEAKATLLEQYKGLSTAKIKVVDQEGGIRPTVADRRPLIGAHPEHNKCFIFNGMGTKGYMLAPFFANHFYEFFTTNTALDKEVNIERFYKKYYSPRP